MGLVEARGEVALSFESLESSLELKGLCAGPASYGPVGSFAFEFACGQLRCQLPVTLMSAACDSV